MQATPIPGQPITITCYEATHCVHCNRAITRRVVKDPLRFSIWLHTASQESECPHY